MDENKLIENLTRVEESTKSAHKRIDSMECVQKEIRDLAMSVNTLAGSVKNFCEDIQELNGRVKTIEEKPARRWEQLMGLIMSAIACGIIGFLLSQLLNK